MYLSEEIGFVIQARTGSKRLPNKVLKPFYDGYNILEIIVNRIQKYFPKRKIAIATSQNKCDDGIADLCEELEIECVRGSEVNVLSRFLKAVNHLDLKYACRICGDNPFIDINSFRELETFLKEKEDSYFDYISYKINGIPSIKTHFGLWGELISVRALRNITKNTSEKYHFEHVTSYVYEHPEEFSIKWVQVQESIAEQNGNIRLTLDTYEDYILQKKIYKELISKKVLFKDQIIVEFLLNNEYHLTKMQEQISKNKK